MSQPPIRMLPGGNATDKTRPMLTVDLDGVLCEPPFGLNVTVQGPLLAPEAARSESEAGRLRRLLWSAESFRYVGRRCMPGAEAFLQALARQYRLVLVTARGRPSALRTRSWMQRNRLWRYLDGLVFRGDPGQPSYAFKVEAAAALAPAWHVDDDGRTALAVASRTGTRVVLLAWPRNSGAYPESVVRLPDLAAAAAFLNEQRIAPAYSSSSSESSSSTSGS